MPRVNLFIADDVGLGKTIEAGLILRELLIRQKVRRVVSSRSALDASSMARRTGKLVSGSRLSIFDRDYVARSAASAAIPSNPWRSHSQFLISHALLRDEAYKELLLDWLDHFAPGSLFIIDEAHNAAPASASRYAIDSMLTRAVRELAPRFEHRLFLSATPHNGHPNSFAALLELLDPQRFCRGVTRRDLATALILSWFAVSRATCGKPESIFRSAKLSRFRSMAFPADAPELRLSDLLDRYGTRSRELRMKSANSARAGGLFAYCLMLAEAATFVD